MDAALFFKLVEKNYPSAKKKLDNIDSWNELDGLYRVYHQSFKMYYELQGGIIDYLDVLFELTSTPTVDINSKSIFVDFEKVKKHYSGIENKILQLDLDGFFRMTILDALNITFHSNDDDVWQDHQTKLTSAMYHSKISVTSIMKVAENYFKEKYIPSGILKEYECICEHVLNFKGYRYESKYDLRKKIAELDGPGSNCV